MPSDDLEIGQNVRRARLAAGLSQADVARQMQEAGHPAFYPQAVTRTEQGARALKFSEAGALSRILNWPLAGFLPGGLMDELVLPVTTELKRLEVARNRVREAVEEYRAAREATLTAWAPAAQALAGLDEDTEDAITLRVVRSRVQRAEAATVRQVLEDALRGEDEA